MKFKDKFCMTFESHGGYHSSPEFSFEVYWPEETSMLDSTKVRYAKSLVFNLSGVHLTEKAITFRSMNKDLGFHPTNLRCFEIKEN